MRQSLGLIGHFVRHIVLGTFLFLVVGSAAIILKLFHDQLVAFQMPGVIVQVTHFLEIFIFAVDVLSYVFFVMTEAYVLCREMLAAAKISVKAHAGSG